MDNVTRRKFLLASGVVGAAALVDAGASVTWKTLVDRARTDPAIAGNKILVVLTLYGGNDGLNTVVPYADDAYRSQRGSLAYSPDEVIKLDDSLGFNPSMKGIKKLWDDKQVAVIRGVGYPKPQYSHFSSMDIWQTGSPDSPVTTGWVGRYLDATQDDPLRAIAIGTTLPPMAVGQHTTAASLAGKSYQPLESTEAAFATGLGRSDPTDLSAAKNVVSSFSRERVVAGQFDPLRASGASSSDTGDNALARQLAIVTRAITVGVPTRVWMVNLGGFDLHSKERGAQEGLWKGVDAAVSSFFTNLSKTKHADDVVMMVHSEFGRRVQANSAQGSDHGSAAPVFVIGRGVRGGMYGEEPSLTDLDEGNLKYTVDFRAVYGELLARGLGTDPHRVLSTVPDPVGFTF